MCKARWYKTFSLTFLISVLTKQLQEKEKANLKNSSYKQPAIYLAVVVNRISHIERQEIDLIKG